MSEGAFAYFADFEPKIGCHFNNLLAIGKRDRSVIYYQIPT